MTDYNNVQYVRMTLRLANNIPALRKLGRDIVASRFSHSMATRAKFNPVEHGLDKEFRLTDFTKMKG